MSGHGSTKSYCGCWGLHTKSTLPGSLLARGKEILYLGTLGGQTDAWHAALRLLSVDSDFVWNQPMESIAVLPTRQRSSDD
eukprot:1806003-Rhodomonas_salina.2